MVVLLLVVALTTAGCATLGLETTPQAREGSLLELKRDPKKYEQKAKEALQKLARAWVAGDRKELAEWDPLGLIPLEGRGLPSALDLCVEAVWMGTDSVMIRASWSKGPTESTGSMAKRQMANFTFDVMNSMKLKAVESENPFDPVQWNPTLPRGLSVEKRGQN